MRLDEKDSACSRRKIGSRCHFSGKTLAGWWLSHPSEKYEFVSWDYYSQYMDKKMFQTTNHQKITIFNGKIHYFHGHFQ
jgi:hypothetical protein